MANLNAPNGFTPVMYKNGKPYTGAATRYYKDATAGVIGVGDVVIRGTNSSDPEGGPEIVKATVGSACTGVVVAIEPIRGALSQLHLAAADLGYVLVADDPDLLFEVQEGTGGTALIVTQVGEHIDAITNSDADTTTGRSKSAISNAAVATDNTFRIERLSKKAGNEVGAHARWLVSINLSTEVNASATTKTEV